MARFISLFAGVGGFDLGMERAGHECVAQVEWDKNAAGVLKRQWPDVPLFCDVSKVSADDLPDADFITYGFPCQDLSVAGKREGLNGQRSGLFYEATRLIRELRARRCRLRIAVAENVAGLFSADDGVALARCIRELLDCGACETGWRLLDSQYFGVAQRRKRVFIVSDFGGESVDEILAVTESLPGHPAPSREAGQGTAEDASKGVGEGGKCDCDPNGTAGTLLARDYKGLGNQDLETGRGLALQAQGADVYNGELTGDIAVTVTSATGDSTASGPKVMAIQGSMIGRDDKNGPQGCGYKDDGTSFTLTSTDKHGVVSWNGDVTPKASEDVSVTLRSQQGGEGVGVATYEWHNQDSRIREQQQASTLSCNAGGKEGNLVRENLTVRRLTPIECERLQGFPDGWTSEKMEVVLEGNEWKATGKVVKQADGPRYKAMGNAVTVNVAEWLGKRIGGIFL